MAGKYLRAVAGVSVLVLLIAGTVTMVRVPTEDSRRVDASPSTTTTAPSTTAPSSTTSSAPTARPTYTTGVDLVTTTVAPATTTTEQLSTTTAAPLTTTTASPSTTTTRRTTTTTPPPSTTTTLHPDGILGIMTTTGVPLRLKATNGDLWVVSSPCGWDVSISGGTPIYKTTVILDPGHGGNVDIGAVGPNGLQEKVVNLRIAQEAQRILDERGIANILTRTSDYASTLTARAALADALQATIMVSIHHNAPTPPPSSLPGNEVFVQSNSPESRRLGQLLFQYSMAALSQFKIQWSSTVNRGVMTVRHPDGHDLYGIIRSPKTTTALIEFGRLTHAPEAELFATQAYVQAAALSIADAVDAYLNTDQQGSGWIGGLVRTAGFGLRQTDCVDPNLGG